MNFAVYGLAAARISKNLEISERERGKISGAAPENTDVLKN
jgi:hypothetical protein